MRGHLARQGRVGSAHRARRERGLVATAVEKRFVRLNGVDINSDETMRGNSDCGASSRFFCGKQIRAASRLRRVNRNRRGKEMENLEDIYLEKRSLALAAVVYYLVMLAAFVIGLYGFLSLFWLASNTIQNAQVI